MIKRVVVQSYRCFKALDIEPNPGMNVLCGANESGKSTLLEAIALALTGKVNGRWATEELNPFWFNQEQVAEYFAKRNTEDAVKPPELLIELYLGDDDEFQPFRGVHNTRGEDCPGVFIRVAPDDEYFAEFEAYLDDDPPGILPVEYYLVDWRGFSDEQLVRRPKALATSFIDSRTIRSTSGVDYHTREMLSEHLDPKERAGLSVAHRKAKQGITDQTLGPINKRIAEENATLRERAVGLQMDQSSRTSWETGVAPDVAGIPFAMAGQGQQASIKVALAMSRTAGSATFILVEEPENHLSHTSLTRLVAQIEALAEANQQLFVSTHSSFVANRLRLDRLLLLHGGTASKLTHLRDSTVSYFRKLADYDTLRLVLADRLVLVEGPSDAIVFERAFKDRFGQLPMDRGIDVISMRGLTFRRGLEVCAALGRQVVALRDNDDEPVDVVRSLYADLLDGEQRILIVSTPEEGATLEPQLVRANDETLLREVLGVRSDTELETWMSNNKTEGALRIYDHAKRISYPSYLGEALEALG